MSSFIQVNILTNKNKNMVNQELIKYIKQQLQSGVDKEEIKRVLIAQGWQEADVNEGFLQCNGREDAMQRLYTGAETDNQIKPETEKPEIVNNTVTVDDVKPVRSINLKLIAIVASVVALIMAIGVGAWYMAGKDKYVCSLEESEQYTIVSGKVVFPKGINDPENYEILSVLTNESKTYPIDADGNFCVYILSDIPKDWSEFWIEMLMARSLTDDDGLSLTALVDSDSNLENFIVDYKTTAVTAVSQASSITDLNVISNNAKVIELANQINSLPNLTGDDRAKGGRLANYVSDAVQSVLEDILNSTPDDEAKYKLRIALEEKKQYAEDSIRVSNITNLLLALEIYFSKNNQIYPQSLDDMDWNNITEIENAEQEVYLYARSNNGKEFHMGIKMSIKDSDRPYSRLYDDDDFNSLEAGFENGFDGADPVYDIHGGM